ncbi:MAG TPA: hypothetical protein PKY25_03310 [Bacilli bacterium]|nr:hypothetical protein [Bacilli bacterium]
MNNYDIIDDSELKKKRFDFIEKFLIISISILVVSSTLIYYFGYNLLKGFVSV